MKQDKQILTLTRLLEDLFEIVAIYHQGNRLVFGLSYRFAPDISRTLLSDRLKVAGYEFELDEKDGQMLLKIDPKPKLRIPPINIILFVLTLLSVYFVPVFVKYGSIDATFQALSNGAGIVFTVAMVSILFVHEMGHFVASRRRNIVTSWPYFIPAPNIIGTFGAIIKSKSPFWNRRDLIEVGAAGPIAGWIVAIAWLLYGLSQTGYFPQEQIPPLERFYLMGESILMKFLTLNIVGPLPEGYAYRITEAAFAGWVGLLVTAINLLPIGQLDGGHIVYGLAKRRQHLLGYLALGALLVLGMQSFIWWFFAIFGIVFGIKHPPTLNDSKKPSSVAAGMGIIALIILVISLTPIPFQ